MKKNDNIGTKKESGAGNEAADFQRSGVQQSEAETKREEFLEIMNVIVP